MQDHPGAPGTARQGSTRTIVSTNRGGKATQPRAPGHERPLAAQRAARHGRLSAALRAPGADVPLAMTAGAPGQHCLSAALQAPGADRPLAITARAPGQHRLSAAPIATAPVPVGLRRLRQEVLPRVPATPNTLIYPHSHRLNRHSRRLPSSFPRKRESTSPRNNGGSTGGLRTGNPRSVFPSAHLPTFPLHTTHQVHPAIQAPPHPRSCSTACTGLLLRPPARAPPSPTAHCPLPVPKWLRCQRLRYDAASCLVLLPGRAR